MPYSYDLSKEAEDDMLEAYIWDEQQKSGLREEFLESLDKASLAIVQSPDAYRIRYNQKVRAFVVERFPYLILYTLQRNDVNVIAVFNTSRNPKTWKKRVEV
jgi:plasmid stabilization system protein ParE